MRRPDQASRADFADDREIVTLILSRDTIDEIDQWAGREFRERFIQDCIRDTLWLSKLHKKTPAIVDYLEEVALDALEAHDHRPARRYFERITQVKPDYADAWTHLGIIEYRLRRYERARELFQKGEDLARAELVRAHGTLDSINSWWDDLDTRPYMRALYNLALVEWKLGDHDGSIKICRELLRLNPEDDQGARFLLTDVDRDRQRKRRR